MHLECENGNLQIKKVIPFPSLLSSVSIRILLGLNQSQQLGFNRFKLIQHLPRSISTLVDFNSYFRGTFITAELKTVLFLELDWGLLIGNLRVNH